MAILGKVFHSNLSEFFFSVIPLAHLTESPGLLRKMNSSYTSTAGIKFQMTSVMAQGVMVPVGLIDARILGMNESTPLPYRITELIR